MMPPVYEAIFEKTDYSMKHEIVLMTDGNIGFEDQMMAIVNEHIGTKRLHVVGIGSAPNAFLILLNSLDAAPSSPNQVRGFQLPPAVVKNLTITPSTPKIDLMFLINFARAPSFVNILLLFPEYTIRLILLTQKCLLKEDTS